MPNTRKQRIVARTLASLKPASKGTRTVIWDTDLPGFGIRVTERGHCSFFVMRRPKGSPTPIRCVLDSFKPQEGLGNLGAKLEKARITARQAFDAMREGKNPREVALRERRHADKRKAQSFGAVVQDFIDQHLVGPNRLKPLLRSGIEIESALRSRVMRKWGSRSLLDITDAEVAALVKQAMKDGPYAARHLLAYLKTFFNWAVDQRVYGINSSPCDRIKPKRVIGKLLPRKRVLADPELRLLWKATEWEALSRVAAKQKARPKRKTEIDFPFAPLIRLLLITGQRLNQVAGAQWQEFNFEENLWIVPGERMKGGDAHAVPLSKYAIAELERLPRQTGPYLFSTTSGKKPVSGFSKVKARLDTRLEELKGKDQTEIEPWVFHDLRRTMRTRLSAAPAEDLVRELVIAQTKSGLHKVYDLHLYLDEKREALEWWAAKLGTIVGPTTGVTHG